MVSGGTFLLTNSTISNVLVDNASGSSTAFSLRNGSRADRVFVRMHGAGHACYINNGSTLTNSVCWADSASDLAIETDGSNTFRNVTAYGGFEAAIKVFGREDCTCTVATATLVNVIAKAAGAGSDLRLVSEEDGITARIVATYSNYQKVDRQNSGSATDSVLVSDTTDQTSSATRPKFVNAAAGNFRELSTSKTRNHGTTAAANGAGDLDGLTRTAQSKTDIGAYEFAPPQTKITSGPSGTISDTTPTFAFSSSRAGSTFECAIDAGAFAPCSSPYTTAPLSHAAHTFKVRATSIYADTSPATRNFRVS